VRSESDFHIAQDFSLRLVSTDIIWEQFCNFTADLIKISDQDVFGRYVYGEIRLTRLNFYASLLLRKSYFQRVGYQYKEYFAHFYGSILFVIGVVSVFLSGLQAAVVVQAAYLISDEQVLLAVALWSSAAMMLCLCAILIFLLFLFVYKVVKE
jgi:hypothetical protein